MSAGADGPDAPDAPDGQDASDRQDAIRWVRAAQRGDALAMSRLLDELTPYVGRLCAPIALADGPDAAQEALIAIFQNLKSLHERQRNRRERGHLARHRPRPGPPHARPGRRPPTAAYGQLHINAPFDRVWHYLADMDRSIPDLIGFIRRFELAADGSARATGLLGNRGRFTVDLREGWCVMQDRFVVGGFAAVADGDGTLLAGCGALRTPGVRRVAPLLLGERAVLRTLGKVRRRVA
ncbi:hypothetical protein KGQ20_26875 [Catenulispora sp. NF23]|uniref:Uncharacterized protein n=1 Tax=Catenulispora pinistramenti TaxID=2705254 RepID=A0ABS5KV30_9ACTN|nr:hypothetical protein [Catenulispora pinistramenti]MBS2536390.1 hypothetical protein [Catenulispora pinistramenti]MBS2549911.1 hypothetical protein [Catenulispora pinistramenti]